MAASRSGKALRSTCHYMELCIAVRTHYYSRPVTGCRRYTVQLIGWKGNRAALLFVGLCYIAFELY
jgi:hypothetical protein